MKNISQSMKLFLATVFVSIFIIIERIASLILNFDFNTLFYNNNFIPTVIYITLLAVSIIIYFKAKGIKLECIKNNSFDVILNILLLISFIMLFIEIINEKTFLIPIQYIIHKISLVASGLSVLCYILSLTYTNKSNSFILFLNIFPTILLASELILTFTQISGKANSYYLFPDIISTLVVAYLILALAKIKAASSGDTNNFISIALISILCVSVSIIPDMIFIIMQKFVYSYKDILFMVIKAIYLMAAVNSILKVIKNA